MAQHFTFHLELEKLNKKILEMSSLVEAKVRKVAEIIESRDDEDIKELIHTDYEVDEMEVEIEEDCLKILALHQPVASDLRFIIAVIKINNEIERIADTAANVAKRVKTLAKCTPVDIDFDFSAMSEKVVLMLKMSLDSLVERDSTKARQVFLIDDEVDAFRNTAYKKITRLIPDQPREAEYLINTFLMARHLERIADRATNIAEEVIYLVEGTIVRL